MIAAGFRGADVEIGGWKMGSNFLTRLLSVGGISGLLALILVGTLCARYFQHGPEEIPQILTYALSTIIGFYFGAGVKRATTKGDALSDDDPSN
jgi:hypothetical protein